MPFVTVTAGAPAGAVAAAVASVARAVAAPLGLQPGDVYAALVRAEDAYDGTGAPVRFAAVDIRGRRRGHDAEQAAAAAAAHAVATSWGCRPEDVAVAWTGAP